VWFEKVKANTFSPLTVERDDRKYIRPISKNMFRNYEKMCTIIWT
jgi:hypothetical protein